MALATRAVFFMSLHCNKSVLLFRITQWCHQSFAYLSSYLSYFSSYSAQLCLYKAVLKVTDVNESKYHVNISESGPRVDPCRITLLM